MKDNSDYKGFEIGDFTYGRPRVIGWGDNTRLRIGKFCSIAEGTVILLGGEHHTKWTTTYPLNILFRDVKNLPRTAYSKGDVVIGNDVWIGRECLILSGTTIGNGAVVAANSVVVKDVEPYAIVGGNPAKELRKRFDTETIDALNRIAWWDWPLEKVRENIRTLLDDPKELIKRLDTDSPAKESQRRSG